VRRVSRITSVRPDNCGRWCTRRVSGITFIMYVPRQMISKGQRVRQKATCHKSLINLSYNVVWNTPRLSGIRDIKGVFRSRNSKDRQYNGRQQYIYKDKAICFTCSQHFSNGCHCGAETANPSGTPAFIPVFSGVRVAQSLVFCIVFCISLSVCLSFFLDCLFNHLLRIEYSTFVHSSIIKHEWKINRICVQFFVSVFL
jgi:hypothetical protein